MSHITLPDLASIPPHSVRRRRLGTGWNLGPGTRLATGPEASGRSRPTTVEHSRSGYPPNMIIYSDAVEAWAS